MYGIGVWGSATIILWLGGCHYFRDSLVGLGSSIRFVVLVFGALS